MIFERADGDSTQLFDLTPAHADEAHQSSAKFGAKEHGEQKWSFFRPVEVMLFAFWRVLKSWVSFANGEIASPISNNISSCICTTTYEIHPAP